MNLIQIQQHNIAEVLDMDTEFQNQAINKVFIHMKVIEDKIGDGINLA